MSIKNTFATRESSIRKILSIFQTNFLSVSIPTYFSDHFHKRSIPNTYEEFHKSKSKKGKDSIFEFDLFLQNNGKSDLIFFPKMIFSRPNILFICTYRKESRKFTHESEREWYRILQSSYPNELRRITSLFYIKTLITTAVNC